MSKLEVKSMPFIKDAMQGLAFWIGYSRSYFRHYELSEASLVSELCSLIQAKLPESMRLYPEVMYSRLLKSESKYLSATCRADLVILDGDHSSPYKNNISKNVKYIFEVKRYGSPTDEINEDLCRLYHFKKSCYSKSRAFLILASEAKLPTEFVDIDTGESLKGEYKIPGTPGVYRVTRTVKAGASFKKITSAHYVSICEVFEKSQKSPPKF